MPCTSQIISEMLSEIHTIDKCDFLRPMIHSQITYLSVNSGLTVCQNMLNLKRKQDLSDCLDAELA